MEGGVQGHAEGSRVIRYHLFSSLSFQPPSLPSTLSFNTMTLFNQDHQHYASERKYKCFCAY